MISPGYSIHPRGILALLAFFHVRLMHVPGNSGFIIEGVTQPSICYKVRIPSGVFGVASLALYASAPNHVFGQMLGLPGSWVCRLTFCSYRPRRPKENYCDCALVIPDEHLNRESRKLTVMIQRETDQPLDDSVESSRFLRINEGPVSRSCTYAHPIWMNAEVPRAI